MSDEDPALDWAPWALFLAWAVPLGAVLAVVVADVAAEGLRPSTAGILGGGILLALAAGAGTVAYTRGIPVRRKLKRFAASRGLEYDRVSGYWTRVFLPPRISKDQHHAYAPQDVLSGELDGVQMFAFDDVLAERAALRKHGVVGRNIPAVTPTVVVQPREHELMDYDGETVELESIDFTRQFVVTADSRRAAYDVLSPRVMEAIAAAGARRNQQHRAWIFRNGFAMTVTLGRRNTPHSILHGHRRLDEITRALSTALPSMHGENPILRPVILDLDVD